MLDYLIKQYQRTQWPNFYVQTLKNIGVFNADEANNLFKKGIVKTEEGMHGQLIILIPEKIEKNKNRYHNK